MRRLDTRLEGLLLLEPDAHGDERGYFLETFRASTFQDLGVGHPWVQDNHSRSRRGIVRGMHFQVGEGQAKLVRCARGAILDAVVDLRPDSPTYGQWEAHELSDENHRMLYVPVGFAHGFCVTSDIADVIYKCSTYYSPEKERALAFDDPDVAIEWPPIGLTASERDAAAPRMRELERELGLVRES